MNSATGEGFQPFVGPNRRVRILPKTADTNVQWYGNMQSNPNAAPVTLPQFSATSGLEVYPFGAVFPTPSASFYSLFPQYRAFF